jgi:metal-sulfur cluster biosynthetic enzyme
MTAERDAVPPARRAPTEEQVREALRLVIDPEIGVNIVDLGLVYAIAVTDGDVRVDLTMTTPACPLGEYVTTNAEATIWQNVPHVRSVGVQIVWEPAWRPDMMSEAARRQLGGR